MAEAKTKPTGQDAAALIACAQPDRRRAEGQALDTLFRNATGFRPEVWTGGIIGYGRYNYTYKSGRSGEFLATGFALRKREISVYIMPGYADFAGILQRLGPHRTGASCLYITRLERVQTDVLGELVRAGLADLATHWDITPT
ncbi:MAG: DUF1801 domain-containing protein [Pseudomonadota bacterium]